MADIEVQHLTDLCETFRMSMAEYALDIERLRERISGITDPEDLARVFEEFPR